MLNGLATRRYRTGLEPVGDLPPLATGKSAISRRFVAGTTRKLKEFLERDPSQLDLLVLYRRHRNRGAHDRGGHEHRC